MFLDRQISRPSTRYHETRFRAMEDEITKLSNQVTEILRILPGDKDRWKEIDSSVWDGWNIDSTKLDDEDRRYLALKGFNFSDEEKVKLLDMVQSSSAEVGLYESREYYGHPLTEVSGEELLQYDAFTASFFDLDPMEILNFRSAPSIPDNDALEWENRDWRIEHGYRDTHNPMSGYSSILNDSQNDYSCLGTLFEDVKQALQMRLVKFDRMMQLRDQTREDAFRRLLDPSPALSETSPSESETAAGHSYQDEPEREAHSFATGVAQHLIDRKVPQSITSSILSTMASASTRMQSFLERSVAWVCSCLWGTERCGATLLENELGSGWRGESAGIADHRSSYGSISDSQSEVAGARSDDSGVQSGSGMSATDSDSIETWLEEAIATTTVPP